MLTIGHRGAAGLEPENTLRSFQRAIALGCDMVELDVHVCKTGEVVVIHDATVNRTTNGRGQVADLTLAELKKLDAGKGEHIPTLEEVLRLCAGKTQVNVELKGEGTADGVAALVHQLCSSGEVKEENVLISSFHQDLLRRYRRLRPESKIGTLFWWPWGWTKRAQEVQACAVHPLHKRVTKKLIMRAHENDWKVFPWTVDVPGGINRLRSIGVDGIITNYPDRIS